MSFRYLIVILEFLFCWLMYDFATFIHIRLFWGNEIAMAFLLYFRTYCMIKEFFKEKWLGQWELWTPTKTSTQALFKLAEMVSRALAKLGDNYTVIFTYRNNLNYIGFFFQFAPVITQWFWSQTPLSYSVVFNLQPKCYCISSVYAWQK